MEPCILHHRRDQRGNEGGEIGSQDGVVPHALFEAGRLFEGGGSEFGIPVVPDAFHHRPDPQFQGADIGHIVDLQQGQGLPVTLEDAPDFVLEEGIRAAAEGGHFHKVDAVVLTGHPVGSLGNPVDVGPLTDQIGIIDGDGAVIPDQVLVDHIDAHGCNGFAEFVLDQGVRMVGTSCQQDGQLFIVPAFPENFLILCLDGPAVFFLGLQGRLQGLVCGEPVEADVAQVFPDLLLQQGFILEVDGRGINGDLRVHHAFDHVGIAGDHRAVVAVQLPLVILPFVDHIGHEDPVHPLPDQVVDVAVDQFGREADVVAHHIVDPAFVVLEGGGIGQLDLQAAGGEQGMPEGIILVDVQAPGDPDDPLGILVYRTVEEQLVFVVVDVFSGLVVFPVVGEEFLTFVPGIIDAAVAEVVLLDQAVVFAAVALELAVSVVGHMDHVVQGGFPFRPAPGKQGTAVGSHDFRDVAPVDSGAGQQFEGPDHRIILHGASLEDDVVPQVMGVLELQHLVQAVLDHGIGQTGGNVPDGDPFPEALFYLGVHEHRAPGTQVAGFLGFTGQFGKVADGIVQPLGEGFQESAAAGGAGFV